MPGLIMKYFVLKPKGNDIYAEASRQAIFTYANTIVEENPELAKDLREWATQEMPGIYELKKTVKLRNTTEII